MRGTYKDGPSPRRKRYGNKSASAKTRVVQIDSGFNHRGITLCLSFFVLKHVEHLERKYMGILVVRRAFFWRLVAQRSTESWNSIDTNRVKLLGLPLAAHLKFRAWNAAVGKRQVTSLDSRRKWELARLCRSLRHEIHLPNKAAVMFALGCRAPNKYGGLSFINVAVLGAPMRIHLSPHVPHVRRCGIVKTYLPNASVICAAYVELIPARGEYSINRHSRIIINSS